MPGHATVGALGKPARTVGIPVRGEDVVRAVGRDHEVVDDSFVPEAHRQFPPRRPRVIRAENVAGRAAEIKACRIGRRHRDRARLAPGWTQTRAYPRREQRRDLIGRLLAGGRLRGEEDGRGDGQHHPGRESRCPEDPSDHSLSSAAGS